MAITMILIRMDKSSIIFNASKGRLIMLTKRDFGMML